MCDRSVVLEENCSKSTSASITVNLDWFVNIKVRKNRAENSKVPSVSQMLWLEPVAIDIQCLISAALGVELTHHSTER